MVSRQPLRRSLRADFRRGREPLDEASDSVVKPDRSGRLEPANRFCTPQWGRHREQVVERPTFAGAEPFELLRGRVRTGGGPSVSARV